MKFLYLLLFSLLSPLLLPITFSQTLDLKTASVTLEANSKQIESELPSFQSALYEGHYYLLLQWASLPNKEERQQLERAGVTLLQYIPKMAYMAKIPQAALEKNRNWLGNVQAIAPFPQSAKQAPSLASTSGKLLINVLLWEAVSEAKAKEILSPYYKQWTSYDDEIGLVIMEANSDRWEDLSRLPIVAYIDQQPEGFVELNMEGIAHAKAGHARHPLGLGVDGSGVSVSVGDGGFIYTHPDLNNRLNNIEEQKINNHGSHVSGTIAGEGILDPDARGFAPGADLYGGSFNEVIDDDNDYYNNFGVIISNNSYKFLPVVSECDDAGEYTSSSVAIDNSLLGLPEVTHVFAAANDGGLTCGSYPTGFATVANSFNSAKNVLTVGSITVNGNISGFSSRGPVKDGRIKPEIVAVGSGVYSCTSNSGYSTGSGTSYAAPAVTGALALLSERYKSQNGGNNPRGDVMKAIITNSARDLGNPGPDFTYGFGALDVHRAMEILDNNHYVTGSLSTGGSNNHNITLPTGVNRLKVMLYWHDVEGAAMANPALVNDLDLTVTDPASTTSQPLILDPSAANCTNVAVQGVDDINNIEQVVIDNPSNGAYTITVDGTSIPSGPQDYVIVYDYYTDYLQLTYPMGGETFRPGQSVPISWNAAGDETNDFTLEYSLDNGSNWTTISNTIAGSDRYYSWTTPSSISDQVLVRVSWNTTAMTSASLSNMTIMDVPTGITATTDCSGGVAISWNAVTGATSYDVLEYVAGSWSVVTSTTGTSHTISGLTAGQEYVYSVRAINGSVVGANGKGTTITAKSSTLVNSYPYQEGFESGAGGWYTYGKNSSWEVGSPTATLINRAAEGTQCWATHLAGNYNNGERAYLHSPCFDLSSLSSPTFSFAFNFDIQDANDGLGQDFYDFINLQYSTDGGNNWTRLGVNGGGHNWYNNYASVHVWDDTKSYWHSASYDIPTTATEVMFRFRFESDRYTTQEGAAIDNIRIYDGGNNIYSGTDVQISQAVSGTNWLHFESGGNRIASIRPNGNNMGSTEVGVYINSGTIRDNGSQYYLDRNWHITPTTAPSSPVDVRLYLLDTEAEALRTAAGCGGCTTVTDIFSAGITKYSGTNENGTLADNGSNTYQFIIPDDAQFEPYENGYYVEFSTSSFSEFYINGGPIALPVELLSFNAIRQNKNALLQWATASEENSSHFEVEVSLDGRTFYTIGEVMAAGNAQEVKTYDFLDTEHHKQGDRYYRLKMVDKDETYEYSAVEVLNFGPSSDFQLYPNPSGGKMTLTWKDNNGAVAYQLLDALGRVVLSETAILQDGELELSFTTLPKGIYTLHLQKAGQTYTHKVILW